MLDSVTRDKTTPNAGIKRLKFFVHDDESPEGVRVVPFSFKTTGGDCRNLVARQLRDVMAKVGVPGDFRWDPGDWDVRDSSGYVARSHNPWSNVKGVDYSNSNSGDDAATLAKASPFSGVIRALLRPSANFAGTVRLGVSQNATVLVPLLPAPPPPSRCRS